MILILRLLILTAFASFSAQAANGWREGKDAYAHTPLVYANGCYWHRGVRYCKSYCYVEITGKRFCQEQESEATSQGDPYAIERPTVEEIYRPRH